MLRAFKGRPSFAIMKETEMYGLCFVPYYLVLQLYLKPQPKDGPAWIGTQTRKHPRGHLHLARASAKPAEADSMDLYDVPPSIDASRPKEIFQQKAKPLTFAMFLNWSHVILEDNMAKHRFP